MVEYAVIFRTWLNPGDPSDLRHGPAELVGVYPTREAAREAMLAYLRTDGPEGEATMMETCYPDE